jgi:hypothetical protein
MPKFLKKPAAADAKQWFQPGDHPAVRVVAYLGDQPVTPGDWIVTGHDGKPYIVHPQDKADLPIFKAEQVDAVQWWIAGDHPKVVRPDGASAALGYLTTPSGEVLVQPGYWIVTQADGDCYALTPEAFAHFYQEIR